MRRVDGVRDETAMTPSELLRVSRGDDRGRGRCEDRRFRRRLVERLEQARLVLDPLGAALLHVADAIHRGLERLDHGDALKRCARLLA